MSSSSWWRNYISHFFVLLATISIVCYLFQRKKNSGSRNLGLPPGPPGLPILGNLHKLGDLPHQNLCKLSKKYGPIMSIRLGLVPAVVVSSPEMAEMFLKTHDIVFASRPKAQSAEYMSYGQKGVAFTEYGSYWRNTRKFCTLNLFSHSKIESFKSMRREEVRSAVKSIKDLLVAEDDKVHVVDLSEKVGSLVEDITYKMILGAKADRVNLKPVIHEALRLAGAFNFADFVPYIGALDLQGFTRRMIVVRNSMDAFFEKLIEEHVQDAKQEESQHREKDFIDVMLSLVDT